MALPERLISEVEAIQPGETIQLIPLGRCLPNPNNPRGPVVPADVEELAESMRSVNGVLQPLVVTPHRAAFYIVAGHRRREAARLAGLRKLPCVVREMDLDMQLRVMLIENIQRKALTPMQEARGLDMMRRLGATNAELVRRTGMPPSFIDSRLALLKLDPKVQKLFEEGELSPSAARALASLENPEEQARFAHFAVSKLLNVTQIEAAVRRHLKREKGPRRKLKKRMIKPDEIFTRTEAIAALKRMGAVNFGHLATAFNDVCEDICMEGKNPELCHACPVPRFIASVLRRHDATKEDRS